MERKPRRGRRFGLSLNEQKTAYMIIGDTQKNEELDLTVKLTMVDSTSLKESKNLHIM